MLYNYLAALTNYNTPDPSMLVFGVLVFVAVRFGWFTLTLLPDTHRNLYESVYIISVFDQFSLAFSLSLSLMLRYHRVMLEMNE